MMTYIEDRFGRDVQRPFKGKVGDGVRFARDPWQTPEPFEITRFGALNVIGIAWKLLDSSVSPCAPFASILTSR